MRQLSIKEFEAKEIIIAECKRHYNTGGCMIRCRCRVGSKCRGLTEENKWNIELANKLK